ncbi:LexA family protein [Denitrobaculum tricleocarpae]|uniref:LexA repressor DNA-binding domain-containing protein n=1 Tax=Denitrobaculum tricleocarpae TaxID=2591009 RepID=A0A545TSY5_9PROT|nr:hypothetical protein [Denitrobaculum tricleocarpae]TQV80335.1 hypothetical protein FKG95_09070 [Denitrobaculum tricleocarpae]
MITLRQREVLVFVYSYICLKGISPTYEEIMAGANVSTKSGVHRLLSGLKDRGYIDWEPHLTRCLTVTRLPDETPPMVNEIADLKARVEALEARFKRQDNTIVVPITGSIR